MTLAVLCGFAFAQKTLNLYGMRQHIHSLQLVGKDFEEAQSLLKKSRLQLIPYNNSPQEFCSYPDQPSLGFWPVGLSRTEISATVINHRVTRIDVNLISEWI